MEDQILNNLDPDTLIKNINIWLQELLTGWGVPTGMVIYTKLIVMLIVVVVIVYMLQFLTKRILTFIFQRIHSITKLNFFNYTINNRLPHYLALIVPYSFIRGAIPLVFFSFKGLIRPLEKLADIYIVFMIIWMVMALIRSFFDVLKDRPAFHHKPMNSYIQVIQIIFFIFGSVAVFCIVTGSSPTKFFVAMGGASAILMLIFQDTIKGFASSIQISTNNMVQIGDWITFSKFGADGNVEEINLTTVKVRNFDMTITTIPTPALTSDSFQNWRGMVESGGRRIKRSIQIKQDTIHFLSEDEIAEYKQIEGLNTYIDEKLINFKSINSAANAHPYMQLRLTNMDLFIQYIVNILKLHPGINKNMTLLVRELAPTGQGMPVEIYAFADTTSMINYEAIQAELINHMICAVKYFDLMVHEESAGSDDYNVYLTDISGKKNNDAKRL